MVFSCTLPAMRAKLLIPREKQLAAAEVARAAEQLVAKGARQPLSCLVG